MKFKRTIGLCFFKMSLKYSYIGCPRFLGMLLLGVLLNSSCTHEPIKPLDPPYELSLPLGFPPMPIPDGNELTQKRVVLGKKLFFDPILSRDSSVSCASCHFQAYAFCDTATLSTGVDGRMGLRNAPPLFNLAYHPRFFRDGGVLSLELQIVAPIESEDEMDFTLFGVVERLQGKPEYASLSQQAYGREPDPFVLTRSIAAFERILISGNSRYDRYEYRNEENALTPSEKRGMDLFFGEELKCGNCHSGFDFSDYEYHNIGLYAQYPDDGRRRITLDDTDLGKFKTPSLRNIALTAPYMHNGSIKTLREVLEHFESGGAAHPNKSDLMQPFSLSEQQKDDLINFLHSLTDEEFVNNTEYQP